MFVCINFANFACAVDQVLASQKLVLAKNLYQNTLEVLTAVLSSKVYILSTLCWAVRPKIPLFASEGWLQNSTTGWLAVPLGSLWLELVSIVLNNDKGFSHTKPVDELWSLPLMMFCAGYYHRCLIGTAFNLHSKTPIPSVTYWAQWLHSDGVVTVVNCQQHGNYTVDQLCSLYAASKYQQWLHRHCPVTV